MVDHVHFPYRSPIHLPFLHVVSESGSWEKHGLEVDYKYMISSHDAHLKVPTEEVEFVGGNHISTYGARARGDTWVYLGQTMNYINFRLVVRPDSEIVGVSDLRGRKVGVRGSHPGLNNWLYLKQRGLDQDRDDVELVGKMAMGSDTWKTPQKPMLELIQDGTVDAAFLSAPATVQAARMGLRVIDIDPLPMIWFTTISSSSTFVEKHPDIVERFLKGIIEGIHYFKTHPVESTKIVKELYNKEGALDDETAAAIYADCKRLLEPKLYPSMQAIANVYQEGVRVDADAKKINPMELWNMHHLRKIDDSGFIRDLYKNTNTSM